MASTSSSKNASNVVALPSMTHSLAHLPTMPAVDPRCLHYGGHGASKEASQAKLQQTLQRRDATSTYTTSSSNDHAQAHPPRQPVFQTTPRKGDDDSDYLMMKKGRK